MSATEKVHKVVNYVRSLSGFKVVRPMEIYHHMGATITDAILQSGLNYDHVVRPRVDRVRREHPEARTTSAFLTLLENVGAMKMLDWKGKEKPRRMINVARFFAKNGIETEEDLKSWLVLAGNRELLKERIRGVGNKTADYFCLLVGISTIAPDRQIERFLSNAGVESRDYGEQKEIMEMAAEKLGIDRRTFDHSVWTFMASQQCSASRVRCEGTSE
jgi:hypothetical protein